MNYLCEKKRRPELQQLSEPHTTRVKAEEKENVLFLRLKLKNKLFEYSRMMELVEVLHLKKMKNLHH